MPKLQHIRVAGRYFENFDIPNELSHLWQYVKEMYELDAFVQVGCHIKFTLLSIFIHNMYKYRWKEYDIILFDQFQSCPADQDIIHMYKMQQMMWTQKSKSREELETPTFTNTVPESPLVE